MWLKNNLPQKDFVLLESIKSKVDTLLSHPKHSNFTDHQITHSERIVEIIRLILNGDSKLNEDEWFILAAAVCLHDIGMQIKREDLLQYPDLDKLLAESKLTRDDLAAEPKFLNFVRDWHHLFSYHMIIKLLRNYLGLSGCRYVEEIALVAMGHRRVDLSSEQYKKRGTIRVRLLSALVRLADELDCDKNRVDLDRLLVQELSMDQKMYWFFHFCVDKLEIRNHFMKVYGRVPTGFSDKFRSLFIIPLYMKYIEVLEVFESEGIVLAWALSDIIESDVMTEIFQKEKGLLEHIGNKSRNTKDIFRLEDHLDEDEILPESMFDPAVSPFYFTGIEKFDGIRIKKWPKDAHYCRYLIFNGPDEIKGDLIPDGAFWESKTVEIGETGPEWPGLSKKKEYGFLIYLLKNKDDRFPLQTLKGKFRILENEKIERTRRLLINIENTTLSHQDKIIIRAGLEIGIGNYEKALLITLPLLKQNSPGQIEILDKINSVYEAIIFEMKRMGWVSQANRINEIRYSLIFKFSRDIHKF